MTTPAATSTPAAAPAPAYSPAAAPTAVGVGYQTTINPIHTAGATAEAEAAAAAVSGTPQRAARRVLPPPHPDARIDHRKVWPCSACV
jgi:hypothetical protein